MNDRVTFNRSNMLKLGDIKQGCSKKIICSRVIYSLKYCTALMRCSLAIKRLNMGVISAVVDNN